MPKTADAPAAAADVIAKATAAPVDHFAALGDDPSPDEVLAAARATAGEDVADEVADESAGAPAAQDAAGAAAEPEGDEDADEPAAAGGERLYAGKYKTVEAMEKGVKELEKLLRAKGAGSLKTGDAPKVDAAAAGEPSKPGEWKEIDDGVIEELGAEWYANNGDLKPETYERLQKQFKVAPAVAKRMMSAGIHEAEVANAEIVTDAGFKTFDDFNAARTWAGANLSEADRAGLDAMLASRSALQRGAAVRTIKALYEKANPPTRKRVAGSAPGTSTLKPITSAAEFQRAMEDPLFDDDGPKGEEYRAGMFQRAKAGGYRV